MSDLSKAMLDVIGERSRQIEAEGWTPEHDDEHRKGELASAALCYIDATVRHVRPVLGGYDFDDPWPWFDTKIEPHFLRQIKTKIKRWWKPKDRRRDLVRAAALLVAEIERLDRRP